MAMRPAGRGGRGADLLNRFLHLLAHVA
jgi:hypothetical protein